MTFRTRLQRLERSNFFDRGCPACRDRRGLLVSLFSDQLDDGTIAEPQGMPAPCVQCGQIPERIIKIVEVIVESPAAVGDETEDTQTGDSLVEVIGGGPNLV